MAREISREDSAKLDRVRTATGALLGKLARAISSASPELLQQLLVVVEEKVPIEHTGALIAQVQSGLAQLQARLRDEQQLVATALHVRRLCVAAGVE